MAKLKVSNVIDYLGNFEDVKIYDWSDAEIKTLYNSRNYSDEVLNAEVVDLIPEVLANGGVVLNIYTYIKIV